MIHKDSSLWSTVWICCPYRYMFIVKSNSNNKIQYIFIDEIDETDEIQY